MTGPRVRPAVGGVAALAFQRETDERFALGAELEYALGIPVEQQLEITTSRFPLAGPGPRHEVTLRFGIRL